VGAGGSERGSDQDDNQRNRAVPQDFPAVLLEKVHGMADFEGELIRLEFFAGDSIHGKPRNECLFIVT
jgi:hypothetical protein